MVSIRLDGSIHWIHILALKPAEKQDNLKTGADILTGTFPYLEIALKINFDEQQTLPLWPDAARVLGLSRPAIYRAAERGDLPVLRFGRRLLVPKPALFQLLQLGAKAAEKIDA